MMLRLGLETALQLSKTQDAEKSKSTKTTHYQTFLGSYNKKDSPLILLTHYLNLLRVDLERSIVAALSKGEC